MSSDNFEVVRARLNQGRNAKEVVELLFTLLTLAPDWFWATIVVLVF